MNCCRIAQNDNFVRLFVGFISEKKYDSDRIDYCGKFINSSMLLSVQFIVS